MKQICANCGDEIYYNDHIIFDELIFCSKFCKAEYVESCLTFEDHDLKEIETEEK